MVDLFAIEHIAADGDLQHTLENRNGLRYISISPWIEGLDWARGGSASARGRVTVAWELRGRVVTVDAHAPEGAGLSFEPNRSHNGLEIVFNGSPIA